MITAQELNLRKRQVRHVLWGRESVSTLELRAMRFWTPNGTPMQKADVLSVMSDWWDDRLDAWAQGAVTVLPGRHLDFNLELLYEVQYFIEAAYRRGLRPRGAYYSYHYGHGEAARIEIAAMRLRFNRLLRGFQK